KLARVSDVANGQDRAVGNPAICRSGANTAGRTVPKNIGLVDRGTAMITLPKPKPPFVLKPSLWCRIFGHKWRVRMDLSEAWTGSDGLLHRTPRQVSYCDRCGAHNPNWTE